MKRPVEQADLSYRFECSSCGETIQTTYSAVGQHAKCSNCDALSEVPLPRVGFRKNKPKNTVRKSMPAKLAAAETPANNAEIITPPKTNKTKGDNADASPAPETPPPVPDLALGLEEETSYAASRQDIDSQDGITGMENAAVDDRGRPGIEPPTFFSASRVWTLVGICVLGICLGAGAYLSLSHLQGGPQLVGEDLADDILGEQPIALLDPEQEPDPVTSVAMNTPPPPGPSSAPTTMSSLTQEQVTSQWSLILRRYEAADSTLEEILRLSSDAKNPLFSDDTEFVNSIILRVQKLESDLEADRVASRNAMTELQNLHGVESDEFMQLTSVIRDQYAAEGRQSIVQYLDLVLPFATRETLDSFDQSWSVKFSTE